MPKIVFCFAGTGGSAEKYSHLHEGSTDFSKDTIRIYIRGVSVTDLFPDLDVTADKIRAAFDDKQRLDLFKLQESFGKGCIIHPGTEAYQIVTPDNITLEGFSRGAVTTFAVAKKLDDLNIPMHIIANQPVPGDIGRSHRIYKKYQDLTECKNIKSANTFLATHNLERGFIHNRYFQQMQANFAPEVQAKTMILPYQFHTHWFRKWSLFQLYLDHCRQLMADNGVCKSGEYHENIKQYYLNNPHKYTFTPVEFRQIVYGSVDAPIPRDPVYEQLQHDKAANYLTRVGMEYDDANLDVDRVEAILAISALSVDNCKQDQKEKLLELVLASTMTSDVLIKIVNKVSACCHYLQITNEGTDIRKEASKYQASVFLATYDLLKLASPTEAQKKDYAENIRLAEHQFRSRALGINRDLMSRVMRVLTNFITHVTGLALIFNAINKLSTGRWMFFQRSREELLIKSTRHSILSDINQKNIKK